MLDANVIFDFAVGGLLDDLLRLPLEFCTPDLLTTELKRPPADQIIRLGLVVYTLSGEQLVEVVSLRGHHLALSLPDVATFVLARSLGVGLLTGERRLRELARTSGIEVHGTLWLLDELLRQRLITFVQACTALDAMLHVARRLPRDEVLNFRRRWGCK